MRWFLKLSPSLWNGVVFTVSGICALGLSTPGLRIFGATVGFGVALWALIAAVVRWQTGRRHSRPSTTHQD